MSAHIHTYTYIHTRIQNVHMNARKARLKRRRVSDCAGRPTRRQEALPFSLSAVIRRGIPFVASSPIARPRGTTDKRRTTTTNSNSPHHHNSAPSRPHPLICTGAEAIHPVHCPRKLPAWPWPPKTRSFFCHFGGVFFFVLLTFFSFSGIFKQFLFCVFWFVVHCFANFCILCILENVFL